MNDMELLQEYVVRKSEEAFETLVQCHINFVYSSALRQVRDQDLAKEITQATFIILARKAGTIRKGTILSGWLFRTVRYVASAQFRSISRRQKYEQEAYMESTVQEEVGEAAWEQLAPFLDEGLAQLGEKDRNAVLLRFFERKSLSEVGTFLGINEDAARKRVSRAVEKLPEFFFKRGIALSAAALTGVLLTNSIQAAPAGLASSLGAAALTNPVTPMASSSTLAKGALKIMAWTKVKTAVVAGVGILIIGAAIPITLTNIEKRNYPWQVEKPDFTLLDKVPPQVKIISTKQPKVAWGDSREDGKIMGIHWLPHNIVAAAYSWSQPNHMIVSANVPKGEYDFIANLPHGSRESLQKEAKRKFGLIGRREIRGVDMLLLRAKRQDAPQLKPRSQTPGSGMTVSRAGEFSQSAGDLMDLVYYLEGFLDVPVMDETGLTNSYDIHLTWKEGNEASLKDAISNQLGLELVSTNRPLEVFVIENAK